MAELVRLRRSGLAELLLPPARMLLEARLPPPPTCGLLTVAQPVDEERIDHLHRVAESPVGQDYDQR